MTKHMDIWDAVSTTDPSHTKRVNQRGGFTAIDAHYQIMNATEQFGPIGVGWGYDVVKLERLEQFVIAHVILWHGKRDNAFGPILGCAEMFGNRPDSDAPKKATTDGITKGLSQLGFNADVFLGKFDDNKYVQERKAEKAKEAEKDKPERNPREITDSLLDIVEKCPTPEALNEAISGAKFGEAWQWLEIEKPPMSNEVRAAVDNRKADFARELTNQGAG